MTWTYSGNPKESLKDYVRFLCGDTDEDMPLLQDEEIQFLLERHKSVTQAAIAACKAIIAKLSREVDYAIGPERVAARQRVEHYRALLADLVSSGIKSKAAPSWSTPEMKKRPALFDIGMHDYTRSNGGV